MANETNSHADEQEKADMSSKPKKGAEAYERAAKQEQQAEAASAKTEKSEAAADSTAELDDKDVIISDLQKRLDEAETKAKQNMELALRVQAEGDNLRRRAERDVANANKYALEKICNELLAVVDSLERGMEHEAEHDESKAMQQGMELTLKMLLGTLEKFGVEQLHPQGEAFNPEYHEAMAMQPNPELDNNTVMAVFQKGYLLNGRLIRPARVVVVRND